MRNNILDFLRLLAANNNKAWFEEHRALYEKRRQELISITDAIISGIRKFDPDLGPIEAKNCLFRQYRDLRFTKNKQPYKTTMSVYIAKGGKNSLLSGYYMHLEPDNCFAGGGVYSPQAEILKAIRNEIYFNLDEWMGIVQNPEFINTFGSLTQEEMLKRPPKGFPADFKGIDQLKYKNYVATRGFNPDILTTEKLISTAVQTFKTLYPLHRFLNQAIDNFDEEPDVNTLLI
ncbi:MAG: DUF2461 domain-containing protein [Bacteroidales bacterium]|nr:DUF2461 domain-containing protein [Bacteroidales bacterium]MDD3701710.1 DUF2461 domain-containing protein [Bacteroidales bacterium]MDY0369893.1 DUF2461 domain-containing protein [Bacteroidales bacterium]